jgi:hypothetical protein
VEGRRGEGKKAEKKSFCNILIISPSKKKFRKVEKKLQKNLADKKIVCIFAPALETKSKLLRRKAGRFETENWRDSIRKVGEIRG